MNPIKGNIVSEVSFGDKPVKKAKNLPKTPKNRENKNLSHK